MRLIVLGVFEENFVHVRAGVLEKLVRTVEYDESYLAVTQHRQLISFLHQTKLSLGEGDLQQN